MSSFTYFDPSEPINNASGNLPHWRQNEVTYFVTFRTAESIPREKLLQWEEERTLWLATHPEPHDEPTLRDYQTRFPARLEQWLDECHGACALALPDIKAIVEAALGHFDGTRYHLGEHIVMPNHVHALVMPLTPWSLSDILHTWKSYTAKQINSILGHSGVFWQKESFDHIVRSEAAFDHFTRYIRENPKK